MRRLINSASLAVVLAVLSSIGIIQVPGIALAQAPEKGRPSAARPAPRAAAPAPRAVARSPVARSPAQRPATVQRSRPERPAVAQRRSQPRAAERSRAPNRAFTRVTASSAKRRNACKSRNNDTLNLVHGH
jgi:hypothetical protein